MRDAKAILKSGLSTGLSLSPPLVSLTRPTLVMSISSLNQWVSANRTLFQLRAPKTLYPTMILRSIMKMNRRPAISPSQTTLETHVSKIDAIRLHNVQLPHAIQFSDQIDLFDVSVRGNLWHTSQTVGCNLYGFHAHFRSL